MGRGKTRNTQKSEPGGFKEGSLRRAAAKNGWAVRQASSDFRAFRVFRVFRGLESIKVDRGLDGDWAAGVVGEKVLGAVVAKVGGHLFEIPVE